MTSHHNNLTHAKNEDIAFCPQGASQILRAQPRARGRKLLSKLWQILLRQPRLKHRALDRVKMPRSSTRHRQVCGGSE